ncbi:uncharacterized protein PAN0_010d4106 [Moesziomyces antarcticus]|uniref:Uncharacterized protein n=2 Tax=Pseudozyma antarctica TaxID=84753 RepID=A0A5C3FMA0_PSEA2|nr:uncharacterized protein PAN0_010d4106 [Moesziomyces antarcticus]GAK65884.1 hypothetical protein PAN0_010d4106 [Moesziomyces antarcticus]SPO45513.1 uncharacterized protein PSANT_03199 [Moesziomyces antarcticus]
MKVLSTILMLGAFCMMVVASTQRVGDECNWSKNCQQYADGVGPDWAKGRITCAVPQDHSPDSCGSGNDNRNNFYGTCKAVGTLSATEYGCECGVHKGDCPQTPPFNRIFWPQNWMADAWAKVGH